MVRRERDLALGQRRLKPAAKFGVRSRGAELEPFQVFVSQSPHAHTVKLRGKYSRTRARRRPGDLQWIARRRCRTSAAADRSRTEIDLLKPDRLEP